MRILPAKFLTALEKPLNQWMAYAHTYETRNYFESTDLKTTGAFSVWLDHHVTDDVVPQDFKDSVTVANQSGQIWIGETGVAPISVSGATATAKTRPSVWVYEDIYGDVAEIYYCLNSKIHKATFDLGDNSIIANEELFDAGRNCSVHAWDGQLALIGYDKGCYWIAFCDESGIQKSMLYSVPEHSLTATTQGLINANYSGMVVKDDLCYLYLTTIRGEVAVIVYDPDKNNIRDPQIAVHADMCETRVTNAYIDGKDNIRLCAQFLRVDDLGSFDSQIIINLDMRSHSGLAFSMSFDNSFGAGDIDETTGQLGHRFQGCMSLDAPLYSCSGRWFAGKSTYFHSKNPVYDVLSISSISGNNGGVNLDVADNDSLWTHPYERAVEVYLVAEDESLLIGSYIGWKRRSIHNGIIAYRVSCQSIGSYMLDLMSSPIYLERDGKQAMTGDILEMGNLARRETNKLQIPVSADTYKKGSVFIFEHEQGTTEDVMTDTLNAPGKYSALPRISELPLTASIYGWSRPGKKSMDDDGIYRADRDTCDDLAKNDTIKLLVKVRKASGLEAILEFSPASDDYFPQTYPSTRAGGAYPITFSASTGLDVGDTVLSLGARCATPTTLTDNSAASGQWATTYIERIDVSNLLAPIYFKGIGEVTLSDVTYNSETRKARVLRNPGDPAILSATSPYNAEDFDVVVEGIVAGANAWLGCVGLHDGESYLVARKSIANVQLCSVKTGKLTVIATAADVKTQFKMLFRKRANNLKVYVALPSATDWGSPALEHEHDASTASLVEFYGYLTTGVYMHNASPWARVTSKKKNKQAFLAAFQVSNFADFPSTGILNIGGRMFDYTGKVNATVIRGPYPVTQYHKHKLGGFTPPFVGIGRYENGTNQDAYSGLLHGDNFSGGSYQVGKTLYNVPALSLSTVVSMRERIVLQVPGADDNVRPNQPCSKGWITLGFSGVTGVTDADQDSWVKCGELAFLDNGTAVSLVGFYSSSGQKNLPMKRLISEIGELSGAQVEFPGDKAQTITLSGSWQ